MASCHTLTRTHSEWDWYTVTHTHTHHGHRTENYEYENHLFTCEIKMSCDCEIRRWSVIRSVWCAREHDEDITVQDFLDERSFMPLNTSHASQMTSFLKVFVFGFMPDLHLVVDRFHGQTAPQPCVDAVVCWKAVLTGNRWQRNCPRESS